MRTLCRYSMAVKTTHLYVPVSELTSGGGQLKRSLTFRSKYDGNGDGGDIRVYDDTKPDWFGVPLYHYSDDVAEEIIDRRSEGTAVSFEFLSGYRPGQAEVIGQFDDLLLDGATGFIFRAPPAFGKTVLLLKMIQMLERTTLVVVPRSNLIKQWIERITEHTSLIEDEIGWAEGGKADWEGKPIVVGLVHTLALDRFGPEFKEYFGTVVFDEVDRSTPPQTFAPVAAMFPARYRIGASATMKRRDGLHVIFEKHMGQHVIVGRPEKRVRPTVLIVEFGQSSGRVYEGSARLNRRGMLLTRLSHNGDRNALLAHYIRLIYNSGRRCLVLSDRTLQLRVLRSLLVLDGMNPEEIGYFCRSVALPRRSPREKQKYEAVSAKDRARSASTCKIVLATYGMFAIGSDVLDLSGLVYATPQSEVEQSQGRIERELEGKKAPVVVDIVDTYYKDCIGWYYSRLRNYKKMGLKVKRIKDGR